MSEDKWLDEVLDRTEREEILDSVKRALDYLEDMDVKKAYNVLELLSHSLDGYDVGKSEFEENLETSVHAALKGLDDPTNPSYIPLEMFSNHGHSHGHSHDGLGGTHTTYDPMVDLRVGLEDMKQEIIRLRDEQQVSRDRIRGYAEAHPPPEQQVAVDATAREYIEALMGREIERNNR